MKRLVSNVKKYLPTKLCNYNRGTMLIEVLVALSLLGIIIPSITSVVITSLSNAQKSNNQNLATKYAQEGVEVVRQIRNNNYTAFQQLSDGVYCLGKGKTSFDPLSGCANTPNLDGFIRTVTIQQTPGCDTNVTFAAVTVSWTDAKCSGGSYCHSSKLVSCFARVNPIIGFFTPLPTNTQPPTIAPTPSSTTLSNLSVFDTANASSWSLQSNLQITPPTQQYGDRSFTFTNLPSQLVGASWIRTANDSKSYTGNPTVTFTINRNARVYVGIDQRISPPKPDWLSSEGWTNSGMTFKTSEPQTFSLYYKDFNAGSVSIQALNTTQDMYTAIVP